MHFFKVYFRAITLFTSGFAKPFQKHLAVNKPLVFDSRPFSCGTTEKKYQEVEHLVLRFLVSLLKRFLSR